MLGTNQLRLCGTLTSSPELKYTPSGLAVLEMNVAGETPIVDEDGASRGLAFYHRVTAFAGQAEFLAERLSAGEAVYVVGRLQYRQWEDQGSGVRRSALSPVASIVAMLGRPADEDVTFDKRDQPRLLNGVNEVLITGNLTRDVELRYTSSAVPFATFGVAVNERPPGKGRDAETVGFYDVKAWRDLAESLAHGVKGDGVLVTGRLKTESWDSRETGERRYKDLIDATDVRLEVRRDAAAQGEADPKARTAARQQAPSKRAPAAEPEASRLDLDEQFPPEEDLPF